MRAATRDGKKQGAKVVVMIPNSQLRHTMLEILMRFDGKSIPASDEAEVFGKLRQNPSAILLVDIFGLREEYALFLQRFACAYPALPVVLLVSEEMLSLCNLYKAYPDFYIVKTELAEQLLLPTLLEAQENCGKAPAEALELLEQSKKEEKSMGQKNGGMLDRELNRRSFLKGSAAAVGTVAALGVGGHALRTLAETGDNAAEIDDVIYSGQCRPNCFGGCFLNIHVRDGKVVRTSARDFPDARYNRICLKGPTHMERIYDPDRLKHPMKRAGERGEGKWERVTWEESIATITDNWKKTAEIYGNSANSFWLGSGSWGSLSGRGDTKERLIQLLGATNIDQSFDMAFCWVISKLLGSGFNASFNEPADMINAKTIFIWGSNPVESQMHNWHFISEAMENGAVVIVIDPIYTETAAKASQYVPIRPGSDGKCLRAALARSPQAFFRVFPHSQLYGLGYFISASSGWQRYPKL